MRPPGPGLRDEREVRLATQAMGTWFEIRVRGGDEPRLRAAAEAAIDVVEDNHRRWSRFEASSLLSHLRRVAPSPVPVDRDALDLFEDLLRVRAESAGAFDPELGRERDGPSGIRYDRSSGTIGLASPAVELDLGAVAKGHAIDLAGATLRAAGVELGFIHGGGSSGLALGSPAGTAWRIALGSGPDAPVVALADAAFSLSSTVERRHIVDPRTGGRIPEGRRAAVIGPSARLADAWSTALLVRGARDLGPGAGWSAWLDLGRGWTPIARPAVG